MTSFIGAITTGLQKLQSLVSNLLPVLKLQNLVIQIVPPQIEAIVLHSGIVAAGTLGTVRDHLTNEANLLARLDNPSLQAAIQAFDPALAADLATFRADAQIVEGMVIGVHDQLETAVATNAGSSVLKALPQITATITQGVAAVTTPPTALSSRAIRVSATVAPHVQAVADAQAQLEAATAAAAAQWAPTDGPPSDSPGGAGPNLDGSAQ